MPLNTLGTAGRTCTSWRPGSWISLKRGDHYTFCSNATAARISIASKGDTSVGLWTSPHLKQKVTSGRTSNLFPAFTYRVYLTGKAFRRGVGLRRHPCPELLAL